MKWNNYRPLGRRQLQVKRNWPGTLLFAKLLLILHFPLVVLPEGTPRCKIMIYIFPPLRSWETVCRLYVHTIRAGCISLDSLAAPWGGLSKCNCTAHVQCLLEVHTVLELATDCNKVGAPDVNTIQWRDVKCQDGEKCISALQASGEERVTQREREPGLWELILQKLDQLLMSFISLHWDLQQKSLSEMNGSI